MFDDYYLEERMTQGLLSLFIAWIIQQPAVEAIIGSGPHPVISCLCVSSFLVSSICSEPEYWEEYLSQKYEVLSILFLLLEPVVSLLIAICWLWIGLSSSIRFIYQFSTDQIYNTHIACFSAILLTVCAWWYRFTRMPDYYKY
jgi:hypothetical protein